MTRLALRLEELGMISDEPERLVRTFLSPASKQANLLVTEWMKEAGLEVREDAFGNLIGCRKGPPDSERFVIGSHLDTVVDAGKYDGPVGVLIGIEVADRLRDLPFGLEIVGFSDEEGVRFQSTYLGSRAYLGAITEEMLEAKDEEGISVAEAVKSHGEIALSATEFPDDLLGYLEVHIEQGPVLEDMDMPLGVVSGIAGQTRLQAEYVGMAGHAGTVPMRMRLDALAAAAEYILAVESYARTHPPLLATVGKITALPGAGNVIAGSASFTIDIRSPDEVERAEAVEALLAQGEEIAERRKLTWSWTEKQSNPAVLCDVHFKKLLTNAVAQSQNVVPQLSSGAGHDAVIMQWACPIAMLFVRCRDGLSHHPDEYASPEDLAAATEAAVRFVQQLAENYYD